MFAEEIGIFVEPYKEGKAWHMAKLIDRQVRPDSASAEHILIAYNGAFRTDPNLVRTKEEARILADSIHGVLSGQPFLLSPTFQTPWGVSSQEFWLIDFGASFILGIEGRLDFQQE